MQFRKSQRAGRKNNNDKIRELVALLGSLSHTGDSITIAAISSRLGLTEKEAQAMMDIVCQASGEDIGGLLISSNDDETEYTLQYPGTHGRPIRLSMAETVALIHALDYAGVNEQDLLRQRLKDAFYANDVVQNDVRRALGAVNTARGPLYICAQALTEHRSLHFNYLGIKDVEPHARRAVITSLSTYAGRWYAHSYDLDIDEERNFRIDRMSDVKIGESVVIPKNVVRSDVRQVGITFFDKAYYNAFDWPGLRILHEDTGRIEGEIPYYGECSTWLLRRICAGNGSIIVDDKGIMSLARAYAQEILSQHNASDS